MILKAFGIFRCTSGFTNEATDLSSEHGVGVIKRKYRIKSIFLKLIKVGSMLYRAGYSIYRVLGQPTRI